MNTDWERYLQHKNSQPIDNLTAQSAGILTLHEYTGMRFSGEQNQTFLQGQFTCDLNHLHQDNALLGACCDNKGRLLANGYLYKEEDDIVFWLPKSVYPSLHQHLNLFAPFSRVTLSEIPNTYIQLGIIDRPLPPLDQTQAPVNVFALAGSPSRHAIIAPLTQAQTLWEHYQQLNTPIITSHAWDISNIQAGYCTILPDTTKQLLPQMINLHENNGVSFTKGCYVGQEIIARTQHLGTLKRTLQTIVYPETQPTPPGTPITNDNNQPLGIVVNSALTPEGTLALAVIQTRALNEPLSALGHPITIKQ